MGKRDITNLPNLSWDDSNKLEATGKPQDILIPAATDEIAGVDGPYSCFSAEGTQYFQTCVYRAKQIVEGRNPLCE